MSDANVDLSGQVALITGGGRGLGRAFAQALASEGIRVAVTARSEDQLAETVKLIEVDGGEAVAVAGDASRPDDIARVVASVAEQLGPVDLLVNNAGVPGPLHPLWDSDEDQWWNTLEVNLRGPYLLMRAVLPGMIQRRSGRIINISSGAIDLAFTFGSAYGASKAALTYLTNTLAAEVEELGVTVLAYMPGLVRTAMSEYVSESPEVDESVRNVFQKMFAEGVDTPIEDVVQTFMFLASGRADVLSGRVVNVSDTEADLLGRIAEIQESDLYTLRLRK